MAVVYLLDTGPLGMLAHDNPKHRIPLQNWLLQEVSSGASVCISEVADYEVRRELTRLIKSGKLPASRLDRLDRLATIFTYLPVVTSMWRIAAELWADARMQGLPTAGNAALDADVLIAAQAREINGTVMTSNPAHIGRWVPVVSVP